MKGSAGLPPPLCKIGVKPGDTVAVMDWDSHRYLECFFAVPMIGAVLHTVNTRLSAEQLVYTITHAEDTVIIVNSDFLPILDQIKGRIDTVKKFILIDEGRHLPAVTLDGEYEALLASGGAHAEFPDFDENTRATTFYSTGTTGMPKGVYFSHRQLVLHTLGTIATLATAVTQGRFHREDVYMPLTPMFHVHAWGIPYVATMLGVKQVYPGKYVPEILLKLIAEEKVTFSHCVPTILNMLVSSPAAAAVDLSAVEGPHRRRGPSPVRGPCRAEARRGRLRRLRAVRVLPGPHVEPAHHGGAEAGPGGAGRPALPHRQAFCPCQPQGRG